MYCLAKTRKGLFCKKAGMANGRCRLHGGLSPKGKNHWNYQGKGCTKEERKRVVTENANLRFLRMMAIELGMIKTKC